MAVLLLMSLIFYALGLLSSILNWRLKKPVYITLTRAAIAAGFVTHSAALVWHGIQVHRFPLTGHEQEVLSFLGWALVLYYLISFSRYRTQALTAFILPLVFCSTLAANLLPTDRRLSNQLTGLTDSWLFPLHTGLFMFSYAAFFVMFAAGIMYLIQERELKLKRFGSAFFQLPSLTTCDEISYRSLTIGFVLLSLAMIFGVVLNGQRDGRFWHNDPKEIIAVMTWLLYLSLIHYRLLAGWRGHRAAIFSIVGFGLILFSLFGARYLGGYHVFG